MEAGDIWRTDDDEKMEMKGEEVERKYGDLLRWILDW